MKKTQRDVSVLLSPGMSMPYLLATSLLRSAITGNGILTPVFSSILRTQAMCEKTLSMLRPSRSVPRFCRSGKISAKARNSVVQTGVKSAGCEKRISQRPSKSLRLSVP